MTIDNDIDKTESVQPAPDAHAQPPQQPSAPPPPPPMPPVHPRQSSSHGCLIVAVLICLTVFAFATLMVISSVFTGEGGMNIESLGSGDAVALVRVEGLLTGSEPIVEQIKRYSKMSAVKAMVVRINSPGGFVAPSQEIFYALKRVRGKGIPVVASMGTVAASGGYYVALGADKIFAMPGTATGSIGVILSYPTFGGLFDKVGVSMEHVKSGKFKDIGDMSRSMTDAEREVLQERVDEIYEQFVEAVAASRNMDIEQVKKLADGRVYSGRQAVKLNLIDAEGDLDDAIMAAAKEAGIEGEPRVLKKKKDGWIGFVESFKESASSLHTRAMLEQHIPMFLMK
ncbi:MAG: signal peptide peptidase SppA [Candidatus Hydrogenedentes bacterium]|nr:signal peptide peptidase SppA [Candidatus Hydrogenedentota bacterium]